MDKLRVKDFPRLDSPKVNPHASNSLKHDPGRKNLLGSGVGGVQVKEGEETKKVCDFCTMCSAWYMLNDTLTKKNTMDLGFPLANRKGQRE